MQSSPFQRTIGVGTAMSIVAGGIIGSGIFMRPAEMAGLLGSPLLMIAVWVVGGLFTLMAALAQAEIGAMLPESGGQYVFMRQMYGRFGAYLFGWANFAVINTAGTAAIAFICTEYAAYFIHLPRFSQAVEKSYFIHLPFTGNIYPLEQAGQKGLTIIILLFLTLVNHLSRSFSAALQVLFTVVKVAAIIILSLGLFFSGAGGGHALLADSPAIRPAGFALVGALVAACNGALQAYDGWGNSVNLSGEMKDPAKTLPRSIAGGLIICIICYITINLAMLYVLPVEQMARSGLVASDAAKAAFGGIGGALVAALIIISTFGATNASVWATPRLTWAMARDGNFFKWAGRASEKYHTPARSLWLHAAWMVVMVCSGSFYILADMYIFVVMLFNVMLLAGVFILRKKMPHLHRPYKVWGYPWMPAFIILLNLFYLVFTLYTDISAYASGKTRLINSVFGVLLTAAGIPFYFYFKKRKP